MNRRTRFCRPLHNHFATPPRSVGLRRPIPRTRLAAPEAKLDCNAPAPKAPGAADRGAEKRGPAPPFSHPPRGRESPKPGRPSIGAGNEARTRDLNLGKVALYQLSYSRNAAKSKSEPPPARGLRPPGRGKLWSGKRGSNSRHQPWEGCALPTELFPPGTGQARRRKRKTRRPAQNRADGIETGAGNEARTRDLNLGKVALYQLSYSRMASNPTSNLPCRREKRNHTRGPWRRQAVFQKKFRPGIAQIFARVFNVPP